MSGKPAARMTDKIACLLPQVLPALPPPLHALPPGLPIVSPCAPTVFIGGLPAARISDWSICITPVPIPNPILMGAFPVPICNMPAARVTDSGTHPSSVIMPPCCTTVLIGLSGVAGNVMAGRAMCQAASAGRTSGTSSQSYQNCGVESSRQIINQANGSAVTEDALLNSALSSGDATTARTSAGAVDRANSGGTSPSRRQSILGSAGVASSVQAATPRNLGMAMSRSSGVVVSLDAGRLWNNPAFNGGGHAVTVIGAEYDDAGNLTDVYINDTGNGNCAQKMPANQFFNAVNTYGNPKLNVTNNPIF